METDQDPPPSNGSCLVSSSASAVFRKIEFHPARKPFNGFSNGGGSDFKIETLNPSSSGGHKRPFSATTLSVNKKQDGSDLLEHGFDPELSFTISFRKIGAGLENLGNTCFLNSVLQCLTYTEPFAAYLQNVAHQKHCRVAGFCALCAMQKHVRTARQATGRILAPKDLVSNLRCVSRNFRNCRQEDAHEYMINLLECMHKCCLPSGVPSESSDAYRRSLVHKIFGGSLRSQVKCEQCSHCSDKFDPFLDLSLDISRSDSLQRALVRFTAVEFLDDGAKVYQCERCKQKVRAKKQLTVSKAPYVLTVHLKRFEAHRSEKIDRKVHFPSAIDMKPYVSGAYEGNLKYTLYGVLVHYGRSIHSGHYACFVRTSSGMWYSLDDNRVIQVSERTVFDQKAYMLFYVRDRQNVVPKNTVSAVKKESLAKSPSIISSGRKDQVNGSKVIKECGVGALVSNGSSPLKSCDLGTPVGLAQKGVNTNGAQKNATSSVEAKESCKNENGSASLKSCETGARIDKDLNAKETQKSLPSILETKEILRSENNSGSLKSCDLAAPIVIAPKELSTKETLQKDVPLPQSNGEGSLIKEDSKAACGAIPSVKPSPLVDGSTSTKTPLSSPTTESEVGKNVDVKNSVDNWNEAAGSQKAKEADVNDWTLGQNIKEPVTSDKYTKATSDAATISATRKTRKRNTKTLKLGLKSFKLSLGLRKKKKPKREKLSAEAVNVISEELLSKKKATGQEHKGKTLLGSLTGELEERTNQNDAVLASDQQQQQQPLESSVSSEASQDAKRKRDSSKDVHKKAVDILTRGLPETVVAKWDEKAPSSMMTGSKNEGKSIGYVPDEWDEEYDRGKKKKKRIKEESYDGPNPFQAIATERQKATDTKTKKKWTQRIKTAKTAFRIRRKPGKNR